MFLYCILFSIIFNNIRLSEKFLSFHKMIIDEQQFLFYIDLYDLFRHISIITFVHNSINQYKTKNMARLLFPHKTFRTT